MATTSKKKCGRVRHSLPPPRCWRSLSALRAGRQRTNPPMPRCRRSRPRFWAERIQAAWARRPCRTDRGCIRRGEAARRLRPGRVTTPRPRRAPVSRPLSQRASDGRRWRGVEFDAMASADPLKPRRLTRSDRWTSGFDGSRHYVYKTRGNEVIFGESENRAAALQPRELFWPQSWPPARNPRHGGDQDRPEDRRRDALLCGRVGRGPVAYQVSDRAPPGVSLPSV